MSRSRFKINRFSRKCFFFIPFLLIVLFSHHRAQAQYHLFVLGLGDMSPPQTLGYDLTGVASGRFALRYTHFIDFSFENGSFDSERNQSVYRYEIRGNAQSYHILKTLGYTNFGAGHTTTFDWAAAYIGVGFGEHNATMTAKRTFVQNNQLKRESSVNKVKFSSRSFSLGMFMMQSSVVLETRLLYTWGDIPIDQTNSSIKFSHLGVILGIGYGF